MQPADGDLRRYSIVRSCRRSWSISQNHQMSTNLLRTALTLHGPSFVHGGVCAQVQRARGGCRLGSSGNSGRDSQLKVGRFLTLNWTKFLCFGSEVKFEARLKLSSRRG